MENDFSFPKPWPFSVSLRGLARFKFINVHTVMDDRSLVFAYSYTQQFIFNILTYRYTNNSLLLLQLNRLKGKPYSPDGQAPGKEN